MRALGLQVKRSGGSKVALMARALTAHRSRGRLRSARPAAARPRAAAARGVRARSTRSPSAPVVLRAPFAGLRALLRALRARPHLRRRLVLAALLATLLGGAWLGVRDSALVAVREVQIQGLSGPEAPALSGELIAAARRQSTLHLRGDALMAAVGGNRMVRAVALHPIFPHGLRITVSERRPVATLTDGSVSVAAAADGTVLGARALLPALAQVRMVSLPRRSVLDARVRDYLVVLGAAPVTLARRVVRVYASSRGVTLAMRNGLLIFFGDAVRPHAKWSAAARVLADPGAAGAQYVDVRQPERPAAGVTGTGSGAGISPGTSAAAGGQSLPTDPTAAALAANLAGAVAGTAPSAAGAPSPPGPGTAPGAAGAPSPPGPGTTRPSPSGGGPSSTSTGG